MVRPLDFKPPVQAERLLRGLLRSPKTRKGLFAAVAAQGYTRNWVYGWLASALYTGLIVVHRGGRDPQYVLASEDDLHVHDSTAAYPAWMCPKPPPPFAARRVYRLGDDSPVPQQELQRTKNDRQRRRRTPTGRSQ